MGRSLQVAASRGLVVKRNIWRGVRLGALTVALLCFAIAFYTNNTNPQGLTFAQSVGRTINGVLVTGAVGILALGIAAIAHWRAR